MLFFYQISFICQDVTRLLDKFQIKVSGCIEKMSLNLTLEALVIPSTDLYLFPCGWTWVMDCLITLTSVLEAVVILSTNF